MRRDHSKATSYLLWLTAVHVYEIIWRARASAWVGGQLDGFRKIGEVTSGS